MPDAKTDAPQLSGPSCRPFPNLSHPDLSLCHHLPNTHRHLLEHHPAPDPWIHSRMAYPRNKCLIEPTTPELRKWK